MPPGLTRVFIGIPVQSSSLVEFLADQQYVKDLPVRWIREEDLHVTLIPPWYTSNIEKEKIRLASFVTGGPFAIFFHSIESVPRAIPHILWLRSDGEIRLLALKFQIEQAYNKHTDSREYTPHITLARYIDGRQSNNVNPIRELFDFEMTVSSVCLYQSHTSVQGSWYEKLLVRRL